MNDINKDIEILESECYYLEELGYLRENNHFIRFNQALENLIKGYREKEESEKYLYDAYQDAGKKMFEYAEKCDELEKENESKEKAYNDCYCEFKHYKQYESIPKSKVKEKIEELKKMNLDCDTFGSMRDYSVLILKELMEDK